MAAAASGFSDNIQLFDKMSQGRKLKQHLRQLNEIKDIMDAMKNLAVVETHKLDKLLDNQRQSVNELDAIAADFLNFYAFSFPLADAEFSIWVMFGSERGFCGDFNDKLIEYMNSPSLSVKENVMLIPVGSKLCSRLQDEPRVACKVEGADVVDELTSVLNILLERINTLQAQHGSINVFTLYHRADTGQLTSSQLIPPFNENSNEQTRYSSPPFLNIAPAVLFSSLVDHYLLTALQEIACMSLLAENYQRIRHMTGAIQRLDDRADEIGRKYHMFRQEEITEELEVILLSAVAVDGH